MQLQKLLGLDDYIKETVAPKLSMEMLLWRMRQPMFDSCDSEAECSQTHDQAKDRCQGKGYCRQTIKFFILWFSSVRLL